MNGEENQSQYWGEQIASTGAAAETAVPGCETVESKRQEVEFICRYNAALYEDVRRHYGFISCASAVLSIALGMSVVSDVIVLLPFAVRSAMSLIIAVLTLYVVVSGCAETAFKADLSVKNYYKVLAKIKRCRCYKDLEEAEQEMESIYADEPAISEVCRAVAYNCAIDEMDRDDRYKFNVGFLRYVFRFCFGNKKPRQSFRSDS